jgi:hypothetical protein
MEKVVVAAAIPSVKVRRASTVVGRLAQRLRKGL